MEELLAYGLIWNKRLDDGARYRSALDNLYGGSRTNTGLLLELELVSDDPNSTLSMLEEWRNRNAETFHVNKFGRALMESLEESYKSGRYTKEEFGEYTYSLWCWLPIEIARELPFYELCNLHEYLTSPAFPEDKADKILEGVFSYYKAK